MKNRTLVCCIVLTLAVMPFVTGCGEDTSSKGEIMMSQQVDRQQQHYANTQPIPWFDWSLERYLMIQLYTARNNAVATWSYQWNSYLGLSTWDCASIGYPIPGGTQLDNPWRVQNSGSSGISDNYWGVAIGQAEPNGLFPPATANGTYVMCLNPDGTIGPVYEEDYMKAFPYPMQVVDRHLVRAPNIESSISIDYKNPNNVVPVEPTTTP